MKRWPVLFAGGLVALSLWGQGAVRPAELGAELARLLSTYAPVELFRQRLALGSLAGQGEVSPQPALEALAGTEEALRALAEALSGDPAWEGTYQALVKALEEVGRGARALEGVPEEELVGALGQVRGALEGVVTAASSDADGQGQGWPLQAAFLAQTVLLAPSPLYLNVEESWAAYLMRGLPPGFPSEGALALDVLLGLANRRLSREEEGRAREAAQVLLESLLGPVGGGGGA
ncbi:MAG: hypothetical protein XD60_1408 [Acetothermia bacterium 64_32]|nr:MAG: hypothetical protein XD60_1408 [Acetothermia bacterium 64_32]